MKDYEKLLMIGAAEALLLERAELVSQLDYNIEICLTKQREVVDKATFLSTIVNLDDLIGWVSILNEDLIYAYIRTQKILPIVTSFHYLVRFADHYGILEPADWRAFAHVYNHFHLTFPIDERRNYADHDMAKQFNEIRRIFKKHLVES